MIHNHANTYGEQMILSNKHKIPFVLGIAKESTQTLFFHSCAQRTG
jgi:hypothetical protein